MIKIGEFSKISNGSYQGRITTLSVQAENVLIEPMEDRSVSGPHFRMSVGETEIGLGWRSSSVEDPSSIDMVIDDPSFSGPIKARLVVGLMEDTAFLTWSR